MALQLRRVEYSSVARFKYDDTLGVAQAALAAGPGLYWVAGCKSLAMAGPFKLKRAHARPASGGLGGSDSTGRGPLRGVLGALKLRNARASGVTLRLPLRQGQPSCPLQPCWDQAAG